MRVFLTGGTGFIGSEVARRLRERGDDVRALVRNPDKAPAVTKHGCEVVRGDLADAAAIARGVEGCDAVIHAAAVYEVGVPAGRRDSLMDANLGGTDRVLTAAKEAGVRRAVYVSTAAVFGNTRGAIADETYQRPARLGYTSVYEESKVLAHRRAQEIAAAGLPLVTVLPGVVYGPGDTSQVGNLVDQMLAGKLPALPFPAFGITPVHRDDVAEGILLALGKGRTGESYVLAGDTTTMRGFLTAVAEKAGRKPPNRTVPTGLVKALAPFGRVVGPLMGFPPNMKELVTSSDGVTFWVSSEKARRELGWTPRPLADGVADLVQSR